MTAGIAPGSHVDADLTALQNLLLEMAGRAEELVRLAVSGLARRDPSRAEEVREADSRVDQLDVEINRRVLELLALRHPVAGDLRLAFVVLKACRDIERIGDHAVNIASAGERAAAHSPLPDILEIAEIGDLVRRMLGRALGALVNRDAKTARAVIAEDKVVDTLRHSALDIIVSYMSHRSRYIPSGVNMILIVQNLERIGDLATNIAEEIVFLVEGRLISHSKSAQTDERERPAAATASAERK